MIDKKILILAVSIISLLMIAWSPWITGAYSEDIVSERFNAEWQGVNDGCGFNCDGCGIKGSQRTIFGVYVRIEFACGKLPSDSPEYHETDDVFVSFLGTIHGLKRS